MKDNGSFGAWDWDALANEWDELPLGDWGVPAWKVPEPPKSGLPSELDGVDIDPEKLPKIDGDDLTAMERVIIVYPKSREAEVAQLIGLEAIEKVVYNIGEILPEE